MMIKQILFIISIIIAFGILIYTFSKVYALFKLTKKFPQKNLGKRTILMFKVAISQSKIFRKPFSGVMHALVFWGFCIVLFGSIEMMIDGATGTERSLSFLGIVYKYFLKFYVVLFCSNTITIFFVIFGYESNITTPVAELNFGNII